MRNDPRIQDSESIDGRRTRVVVIYRIYFGHVTAFNSLS